MGTLVTWQEFTAGARPQGGTIPELVLAEVADVVSKRRPLMANLRSRQVDGLFVELLEDTLPARAHNATLEGAAATDPNLSQPTRFFVHVQSFSKWGIVSDESRLVRHINEDPFSYQVGKNLQSLLNDIEHAAHRGSAATGATNATRQLTGLLNIFTTPTFTSSSGTTFTEGVFLDLLQLFRTNAYDIFPTQAYVSHWLKRTISEYSTKVTRNVEAAARLQTLAIERHSSDFGDVDILYSEDQLASATKTTQGNSIVFLEPGMFELGWLRSPTVEPLPRDGFRHRFQMNAQCTLLYKSAKAGGGGTGFVPYITTT